MAEIQVPPVAGPGVEAAHREHLGGELGRGRGVPAVGAEGAALGVERGEELHREGPADGAGRTCGLEEGAVGGGLDRKARRGQPVRGRGIGGFGLAEARAELRGAEPAMERGRGGVLLGQEQLLESGLPHQA